MYEGKIEHFDAISSLVPGSSFVVRGEDEEGNPIVEWNSSDKTEPTAAAIKTEMNRLQVEQDKLQYQTNRIPEYPRIQDIIIALAEKAEGNSTMWDELAVIRAAVKTKWPKDNSGPVE